VARYLKSLSPEKGNSMSDSISEAEAAADADRRKFLASCGKFAAVTPPAITLLLSTSLNSTAIASSGAGGAYGGKGNNGWGNGGGDGSPNGRSDYGR
jgi:hypothetical protein